MKTKIISLLTALTLAIILVGCGIDMQTGYKEKNQTEKTAETNILKTFGFNENVTAVAGGMDFSLVLTNNGDVYATGLNGLGQLGVANNYNSTSLILTASNIKAVSSGAQYGLILTNDGNVYSTGCNGAGQLGIGNTNYKNYWQNTKLSGIKAITSGWAFNLALTNEGRIYACGFNIYGSLGNGNNKNQYSWQSISGLSNIKAIASGGNHSMALTNGGTVYVTGRNLSGQLGLNNNTDYNKWTVIPGSSLPGIKAIACGELFSLALGNDGYVYATGENSKGQLGLNNTSSYNYWKKTNLSNIKAIACGDEFSLALGNDGYVYAVGDNSKGQLGLGNNTGYSSWQKSGISDIAYIDCGAWSSFAVKNSGHIYAVGDNQSGQLGLGNKDSQNNWREIYSPYTTPPDNRQVRLENYWQGGKIINVEDRISHTVECGGIYPDWLSAKWIMTKNSDGYYTFKCAWDKTNNPERYDYYLHMQDYNNTGLIEWGKSYAGEVPSPAWETAQWLLEPAYIVSNNMNINVPNCYRIKNRSTGRYMYIEHLYSAGGNLKSKNAVKLEHDPLSNGWNGDSAKWYIRPVN